MKTIMDIFIIGLVGVILFSGVSFINNYMFLKGDLDSESENLVLTYDTNLALLLTEYNNSYNAAYINGTVQGEVETDVNTLDAFVKEYGEAKAKVGILRQSTDMITHIPDMLLLAIPFVEQEDLAAYKQYLFYFIIMIVIVAIFVALFQRVVSK